MRHLSSKQYLGFVLATAVAAGGLYITFQTLQELHSNQNQFSSKTDSARVVKVPAKTWLVLQNSRLLDLSMGLDRLTASALEVKINDTNRPTIAILWASWCGYCKRELKELSEIIQKREKDLGVDVILISVDENLKQAKQARLPANIKGQSLFDLDQRLHNAFAPVIPVTILFDKDHNEIDRFSGFSEGRLQKTFSKFWGL